MVSDALLNPDMQAFLVDTINTAQDLFVIDADFFNVDPILLDTEGALKAEEVSALFIAVRSLGLTDSEVLASIGIETFTGLIGRNIDPITGEDDFDRVFGSGYLYITLDKIIQLDAIGTFVSDTLTTSLGSSIAGFDLTLPIAMLGNAIDDELIETLAQKFTKEIQSKGIFTLHPAQKEIAKPLDKEYQNVDLNSLENIESKEIGGEWLCKQAFDKLDLEDTLFDAGLSNHEANVAQLLLTAKLLHPSSESETTRWLKENSGAIELYQEEEYRISRYKLYKAASLLFENKRLIPSSTK